MLGSPKGSYLRSFHFKGLTETGAPEHRILFVPSPSEALAEAVLIGECGALWDTECSANLFSYHATLQQDRSGYYVRYMDGLQKRQQMIARACASSPNGEVRYVDIKRFYPSITPAIASAAWDRFCSRHSVRSKLEELGRKLLSNYSLETGGRSILTGPMFSHFVANLVLGDIDKKSSDYPATYVRYVDDLTLIGSSAAIDAAVHMISIDLAMIGLDLHTEDPKKTISVSCREWLTSALDFQDDHQSASWMRLVGNIKKLLIFYPQHGQELESRLVEEGFRIPIPDYSLAVQEMSSFEKIRQLGIWNWLFRRSAKATIHNIIRDAHTLRRRLEDECRLLLKTARSETVFQKKRTISKLRYRLGRLLYLGSMRSLAELETETRGILELRFHSALLRAVATRDCSEVVQLGSNVAQSAAQVFRATGETAEFTLPISSEVEVQGLAVFIINGVSVAAKVRAENHPLLRLAVGEVDLDLMSQPRGFLQELACLHGLGPARHQGIIRTAFDVDQDISLDALEFDYGYYL